MGLSMLQFARICGAGRVISVDVWKKNLLLSREFGSDYHVDATKDDPVQVIRELTHGLGADIVFECAGESPTEGLSGAKTLNQAFDLSIEGGKVVQIAMFGGAIEFKSDVLRSYPGGPPPQSGMKTATRFQKRKSLRYIFPLFPSDRQWDYTINVVASGQVRLTPMITHVLQGLDKAPEAFEITAAKAKYDAVNPAQIAVL